MRRKSKHPESELQRACVRWWDYQYPAELRQLLFAIPNGGVRSKVEAAIMKGEGVRAGVADMFLAARNRFWAGFFIEFKFGKNKQTPAQIAFMEQVIKEGYWYEVICDFDRFKNAIEDYLRNV